MTLFVVLIIAILQGVTELFPVSSLGHAVILPALLKLPIDENAPAFLPFLVVLHLGTGLALLIYFWRDWFGILRGIVAPRAEDRGSQFKLLELIAIATVPAVVLGFALEKPLRELFGKPMIAAIFLVANGLLLLIGERMRRRRGESGTTDPKSLSRLGALSIGLWQCLAFLPGISRSGATLVGGLRSGLQHGAAAHFSFLIATPVIFGATVLEVPKLLRQEIPAGTMQLALIGGVVAGITAFASTAFLMRYFRGHEVRALDPFAWYCVGAGGIAMALLALG